MGWKITFSDDKSVLVDDMPINDLAKIGARHDVDWITLTTTGPAKSPAAYWDVLRLAAERLEVPVPEHDGSVRSMRRLLDLIEWVEDDRPDGWEDGRPLEDVPTTE